MAFQDRACGWQGRLHLGKVKLPVLVGAACVALLVIGITGFGVARAFTTEGFAVTKGEEAAVVVSDSGQASVPVAEKAPAQVCVYVSGEVTCPDIYYLDEGSRVADAVTAAGGFTDAAATDALNLARTLIDGEQIAVPAQGSETAGASALTSQGSVGSTTGGSGGGPVASAGGRVNINTADAATLQTLNGVGESTAKKIVADREANGPYKTIEDLKRVSGIGDKKFENLRDSICV